MRTEIPRSVIAARLTEAFEMLARDPDCITARLLVAMVARHPDERLARIARRGAEVWNIDVAVDCGPPAAPQSPA